MSPLVAPGGTSSEDSEESGRAAIAPRGETIPENPAARVLRGLRLRRHALGPLDPIAVLGIAVAKREDGIRQLATAPVRRGNAHQHRPVTATHDFTRIRAQGLNSHKEVDQGVGEGCLSGAGLSGGSSAPRRAFKGTVPFLRPGHRAQHGRENWDSPPASNLV
jgi:hypothetical protein